MAKRAGERRKDRVEGMVAEYRDKLPIYAQFATRCKDLVEQLLAIEGVRVHSVTCRAKTVDSLKGKLAREERQCEALGEVTDLAGIRIITYFGDDVDAIGTIIEREFSIIADQSIDKRKALDPDRFGYLSLHYVCTLPAERTRLREYAPYSGYACEVQVRSILQHAWAEIEHDLGYKAPQGIPRAIRRRFSRLAGLLETGDEQFMVIRDELAAYASEVKRDIAEKPSEVLLDKVSLAAFIAEDDVVRRVDAQLAEWTGAELKQPEEHFVDSLAEYLRYVGIETIEDLSTALVGRENVVVRRWQHLVARGEYETLRRGISLFHLWPVVLAEKGDPREMIAAFERFHIGSRSDRERRALETIEVVRQASGEKPEDRPEPDDQP